MFGRCRCFAISGLEDIFFTDSSSPICALLYFANVEKFERERRTSSRFTLWAEWEARAIQSWNGGATHFPERVRTYSRKVEKLTSIYIFCPAFRFPAMLGEAPVAIWERIVLCAFVSVSRSSLVKALPGQLASGTRIIWNCFFLLQ